MAGASRYVPDHRPPAAGIVLQVHGPPTCHLHHVSALSPRGLLCAHAVQEAERRHDSAPATARSCHWVNHRLLRHARHRHGPASVGLCLGTATHVSHSSTCTGCGACERGREHAASASAARRWLEPVNMSPTIALQLQESCCKHVGCPHAICTTCRPSSDTFH